MNVHNPAYVRAFRGAGDIDFDVAKNPLSNLFRRSVGRRVENCPTLMTWPRRQRIRPGRRGTPTSLLQPIKEEDPLRPPNICAAPGCSRPPRVTARRDGESGAGTKITTGSTTVHKYAAARRAHMLSHCAP